MNYYILQHDWDFDCVEDEDVFDSYVGEPINFGKKLNLPKIEINCTLDQIPDCIPNVMQLVIFNQKIISTLIDNGIDFIQYFDVDVTRSNKSIVSDDYKCLNVLKLIDCIDLQKSKLIWSEGDDWDRYIMDVQDLKLDYSKIGDELLFRLVGCENLLVFREDIAQAILNKGCTGLTFHKAEGFSF